MTPFSAAGSDSSHDAGQLNAILESVVARRLAGEILSDAEVIAAHPDCMPRLAEELGELGRIERARLAAAGSSGTLLLDGPRPAAAGVREPIRPGPPAIPGYEFLGEIHRGGQGVVYRARQLSTRREVAVKVVRAGPLADARTRSRFEREVQILAHLKHPNLVAIHDSGEAGGVFYFVMDLIDGVSLDRWVVEHAGKNGRTRVRAISALFARIADAVNAAHLRGVIHRDLKPSNILVVDENDNARMSPPAAQPRILDFGLAKLGEDEAAEGRASGALTVAGQFVGSLPWASPEQAQGRIDLDVRTDVYSLGVMLYHALVGRFPYDVSGELRQTLNHIVTAEPARPGALAPIDADLDVIVLKCLNKDRDRRYQSAGEVARELHRFLAGEPIEARRDSPLYLLGKMLRRYRVAVIAASAFVFLSLAFGVTMTWMYQRARTAETAAESRLQDAEREAAQKKRAVELFPDLLAVADPNRSGATDITVRKVLDQAAAELEDRFAEDPEVEATIRCTLGEMYLGIGADADAADQLETALRLQSATVGEDHPETLGTACLLATPYIALARREEAETLARRAVDGFTRIAGDDDPRTLRALDALASVWLAQQRLDQAESLVRRTLATRERVLGTDHPDTLSSVTQLAFLLLNQQKTEEADELLRRVLEARLERFGEEHTATLTAMHDLATALFQQGRHAEAEPLLRRALALQRRMLGVEHRNTLATMINLAFVCRGQDRAAEAEQLFREALEVQHRTLPPDHPSTLNTLVSLAELLHVQGRRGAELEPLVREIAETRQRVLGDEHPETIMALHAVAWTCIRQDRLAEGEAWFTQAYERALRSRGENDVLTAGLFLDVNGARRRQGRFAEAAEALAAAVERLRTSVGIEAKQTQMTIAGLALVYEEWGQPEQAAKYRALLKP